MDDAGTVWEACSLACLCLFSFSMGAGLAGDGAWDARHPNHRWITSASTFTEWLLNLTGLCAEHAEQLPEVMPA